MRPYHLDVEALAERLRHAGFGCDVSHYGDGYTAPRVRLEDGLSVVVAEHPGFEVVLWTGPDPLTGDCEVVLSEARDPFALPSAVALAREGLPAALASLDGEGRDAADRVRDALVGWRGVPPVVASDRDVEGAIAVSMVGRRFAARLDGVPLRSMFGLDEALRFRGPRVRERYLPIEGDGNALTAYPRSACHATVEGVVRTSAGDAWLLEGFERDETGAWTPLRGAATLTDAVLPEEKQRVYDDVVRAVRDLHERRFDVFAEAEVRKAERRAADLSRRAGEAGTRAERADVLHRERYALRDLDHARRQRDAGRPLAQEIDDPFDPGTARSLGGLRLLRPPADRALDLD